MIKVNDLYVFCISLKNRKDRRDKILTYFSFFNIIFFDAVDTRNDKWKKYESFMNKKSYQKLLTSIKNNYRDYHHDLTAGSVGCFLSHLNICNYIVKNSLPLSLILEDDTQPLISNFKEYLFHLLNFVPNDADIVLLHYILPHKKEENIYGINKFISKCNPSNFQFWCLDSYLLTYKGAVKILENFETIDIQYDSFLSKLYRQGKLNIYICNDQCTAQTDEITDVQNLKIVKYPNDFNF